MILLTLYLLVSSADNFCKQFGPNQARHFVGPDLNPNCLTLIVFLKEFFEKLILKKSADIKNFPGGGGAPKS